VFQLGEEQRQELARWAQSRTLPAGDVLRARLMLALDEGKSWTQIETELGTSRPHRTLEATVRAERDERFGFAARGKQTA
jgi:hypothetical protein